MKCKQETNNEIGLIISIANWNTNKTRDVCNVKYQYLNIWEYIDSMC